MKIFIITDERCGGTVFTRIFNDVFNMKVIHDPQTGAERKYNLFNYDVNLLNHLYNNLNYNVIKCSFCSFDIEQYFKLIKYCECNEIKIIVLYRENVFDRALSIAVARTLRNKKIENLKPYGFKDTNLIKPYNVNIKLYENEIIRYKKDYSRIMEYLTENNINYFHITFNEFFINENKLINQKKLYSWLGFNITNLENNSLFNSLLNMDYNTKEANKLILNFNEIEKVNKKYK